MSEEWLLEYDRLNHAHSEPSVDEQTIERSLLRFDGVETFYCCLINLQDESWLSCRGERDKRIVEYVGLMPGATPHCMPPGVMPAPSVVLARKKTTPGSRSRVHWKTNPDEFVEVPSDVMLNSTEVIAVFKTFYRMRAIHNDFTFEQTSVVLPTLRGM